VRQHGDNGDGSPKVWGIPYRGGNGANKAIINWPSSIWSVGVRLGEGACISPRVCMQTTHHQQKDDMMN